MVLITGWIKFGEGRKTDIDWNLSESLKLKQQHGLPCIFYNEGIENEQANFSTK